MPNLGKKSKSNLSQALFALWLDPSAPATLQNQLLVAIRDKILADPVHSGGRLPASRMLAEELSISRTTVQAVYDQLTAEGYLTTRRGSGTYIAAHLPHLSTPRPLTPSERPVLQPWHPFQIGLPDPSLMPHRLWSRHLEQAWRRPDPALLAPVDPLGWYPLRQAIAEHLAAWRHLTCTPEQVVITSGARESFEVIFRGILPAVTSVAVEDPCWPKTHDVLATMDRSVHAVPIDSDGLDPEKLPPPAKAAIVTPSRHYPTGRSMPLTRRMAMLGWATRVGGPVIEDDYDSEFRYKGQPLPSLAGLDGLHQTIYLGSFSKLISSALRIGYFVVPKRHTAKARAYLERVGPSASLVPQPALAAFLDSGDFAVHLRRMRRVYARRQRHLIAALSPMDDLLEIEGDPSGMHLCIPLRPLLFNRVSDRDIAKLARAERLQIGALSTHSVLPACPQALLLGYSGFDEAALTEAAGRLEKLLRGLV